ncbi:MAG: tRNA (adenosine(37)-N6)-threonylcarbamoyltransferase complex dimerization subunit type 1 TsaB [Solirubrobacteraceae bacterium]
MRILAIDTATRATTAALWVPPGDPLELRDDPVRGERPRHTTQVLALVAGLLESCQVGWGEIDRIAVGVGPGTFTGLRVGIATARALALARAIPLVGVSTLRSLAMNILSREGGLTESGLALLDARRGEVFAAEWRQGEPSEAVLEPAPLSPEGLADLASQLPAVAIAIGDGAVEFRPVLEDVGVLVPEDDSQLHKVTAINHCRLARDTPARGGPEDVRPVYLRAPDAEIALGRK